MTSPYTLAAGNLIAGRDFQRRWTAAPAPCGISHEDLYNPCLPEDDDGWLRCMTCGLSQRPAITTGTGDST